MKTTLLAPLSLCLALIGLTSPSAAQSCLPNKRSCSGIAEVCRSACQRNGDTSRQCEAQYCEPALSQCLATGIYSSMPAESYASGYVGTRCWTTSQRS